MAKFSQITLQDGFDPATWLPPPFATQFTGDPTEVSPTGIGQIFLKTDVSPEETYISPTGSYGDLVLLGGGGSAVVSSGTTSPVFNVTPTAADELYIETRSAPVTHYIIWKSTGVTDNDWVQVTRPTISGTITPTTGGFEGQVYYKYSRSYGSLNSITPYFYDNDSWWELTGWTVV